MAKTITFNELRRIKDSLPDGATHQIADKLNITVQTVIILAAATMNSVKT